jgi:hypothetical protein
MLDPAIEPRTKAAASGVNTIAVRNIKASTECLCHWCAGKSFAIPGRGRSRVVVIVPLVT